VLFEALGDRWGIAQCLELGSRLAVDRERWEAAAHLLAGAEALRTAIDTQLDPYELEAHDNLMQSVRTAVGEERLSVLWSSIGSSLALDDLVALVASVLQSQGATRTAAGMTSSDASS
jgi:uncharacterized protein HemY